MPRLTADEADELNVRDTDYVDVDTATYLAKREELINKATTREQVTEIARKYPMPQAMAEAEAEEERNSVTYEGYGRELSPQEQQKYYEELDAAKTNEEGIAVQRKYGRLDPQWDRENNF